MDQTQQSSTETPAVPVEASSPPPATETTGPNIRDYKGLKYDLNDPKFKGLGKNAIKRILKEEIWEASRPKRIQHQREKDKLKRAERRKMIEEGVLEPPAKRQRRPEITLANINVVLDCSFSDKMIPKELQSLQSQVVRCHSANRTAPLSMPLILSSFDDTFEKVMDKKGGSWSNWKNVKFERKPYTELFDKKDLVYLSADSENVINELEEGKTYIIGGIVDKNRYKGLCQEKASKEGITTGRLPIGEYLQMASRKVLTVNHVFEIMIKWLEHKDWEKAFMEVIPQRKLKDSSLVNNSSEKDQDEEDDFDEDNEDEESAAEKTVEEKSANDNPVQDA
ncbi:guanine-1-methyltransferase-domain-containing protein [Phycomyces nitens]|nr:guanine-1-methyltransferase-domain-containing protein [Phycomyces nitens]